MAIRDRQTEHLLRRAGFGGSEYEVAWLSELTFNDAVSMLVDYEQFPDDVDSFIQTPGYMGVTARGQFLPNQNITDARQRWLFRMVHSQRPLVEKMTLFWHNHFATAYTKIAGVYGGTEATRMMASKASEDPGKVRGQIELLRDYALGNFRDLLIEISKDAAMLVWLDGRTNVRTRPQENYGRELMELFTMGVGFYAESDVYAAARVFTGWNLRRAADATDPAATRYEFFYDARNHDTTAKEFTFPIFRDGSRTIPARPADGGMQDGLDLINAVAAHPETGRRLARKLWTFFVSEVSEPPAAWVDGVARVFTTTGYNMRSVVRTVLGSIEFRDTANYFTRYSWPVEFVVRSIKEVGWTGFSANDALTPLTNMGQLLYEPPDVAGWDLGRTWFSTGAMLSRMNFASQLATNQRINLRDASRKYNKSPEELVGFLTDRLSTAPLAPEVEKELVDYARAGAAWTGSDAQLATKSSGLVHLIVGSSEYQLV